MFDQGVIHAIDKVLIPDLDGGARAPRPRSNRSTSNRGSRSGWITVPSSASSSSPLYQGASSAPAAAVEKEAVVPMSIHSAAAVDDVAVGH
jgi:hypothetical protein